MLESILNICENLFISWSVQRKQLRYCDYPGFCIVVSGDGFVVGGVVCRAKTSRLYRTRVGNLLQCPCCTWVQQNLQLQKQTKNCICCTLNVACFKYSNTVLWLITLIGKSLASPSSSHGKSFYLYCLPLSYIQNLSMYHLHILIYREPCICFMSPMVGL